MILAIDLGSTSFKASVFDSRLREVGMGSHCLSYHFRAGGHIELEVNRVDAALRGALGKAGVQKQDIRAVAITSQAQTFAMMSEGGQVTGPFISWQECRANEVCQTLEKKLPDFGDHASFGALSPALQICKVSRLRPASRARLLPLPSYVLLKLTGEFATDNNMAAMSGLYSLPLKGWWPDALRGCGLRESQLPQVIPVGQVAGLTSRDAKRFGIGAGIPVVLAGNDQSAGGYAARLEESASLLITLGTAQVAYACCRRMPRPRAGTIRGPYPGGLFYRMAADSCGGNVVNWAESVLAACHDDAGFFREAQGAPKGCHGLLFDAAMASGQGGWTNLGLHHTRADLARSILESLAQRMTELVGRLDIPIKGRDVLAAGGGSKQPLWRNIVSEALDTTLERTQANPVLGAARMARAHL